MGAYVVAARTTNELYLMDAVIEPERLVQISLGQENPRMRMNAAPGSLLWPVGPNRSVSVGFQEFNRPLSPAIDFPT